MSLNTQTEKTLMEELKKDIGRSLKNSLSEMTREEVQGLSWFYSEEEKFLVNQKSSAA